MKKTILLLVFLCSITVNSQEYFPVNDGVKTSKNTTVAFTNATIYVTASKIIKNGTLLFKDGKIIDVGKNVNIPNTAKTINLMGKYIYPSFIDAYSTFGIEKPKKVKPAGSNIQYDSNRAGYYWNDHIRPETNALQSFKFDKKSASELLKLGFGVVNTHVEDGIVRGNGLLVSLNPNVSNAFRIIDAKSAQYLSFKKSNLSNQLYPSSMMGSMALLRQMYLDAQWYKTGASKTTDLALESINTNKNLVQIFNAEGKLNNLRADKVGDEFGIQYAIVGSGHEFENILEMKATNATFIIPINFRKAYDVSNPNLASQIALSDMRKWNQEPSNLKILSENDIEFSITTHKLKKLSEFNSNLQKALKYGFNKTDALKALTSVPAKILGKESELGTLEIGKQANFLITSGEIFDKKTVIYENWTQGDKNVIQDMNIIDISGKYELVLGENTYEVEINEKSNKYTAIIKKGEKTIKSKLTYQNNWANISISNESNKFARLNAKITSESNSITGKAINFDGEATTWKATKVKSDVVVKTESKKEEDKLVNILPVTFPNMAFGFSEKPLQETILITNTTVWTNENEGILKNYDVLIKNGKIETIGKNLKSGSAIIIDGTGKHIMAGIIDEHSHIAISVGNEVGHNSTAEVTIEDVINPDDIKIYRSLAGGVTSIQLLHGSANPIGGQSAIIKLKWGEHSDGLLYKNSPKFIKFALGENVKNVRWGKRFPQTRMGVAELYTDYFQRAKEYNTIKKSGKPYRKDIEMETLVEVLNMERFITCHSYVQSEINMLMKVAEKFDFNINTFTHILEGYKVADKMKAHGVGASTFSDWWAYKYEVNDAIPYNAAIMHKLGVTVAINSDDAEMQRRLNQEAAKAIKYGDVSEEDALKFVTLNPAKLLHIDDRVGSIKIGKDADIVLWSDHPLSVYAKAEKTIIDGIIYFDIEKDAELRNKVKSERNTLINMMMKEKLGGAPVQTPKKKSDIHFHCDTVLIN